MKRWIDETASLCLPKSVHICDGSEDEFNRIAADMVKEGHLFQLNPNKRPNSFLCRSTADDVARLESATFICTASKENAGPTNNWKDPQEMKGILKALFKGCMEGRTMYVVPFCMGPPTSPMSRVGVQITDSPYVVLNMKLMTRMGIDIKGDFVPCLHSVGVPLKPGQKDLAWPSRPDCKYIAHFPEEPSVWSFGSGYGGNALLSKKSFALRIASYEARKEMWLAEHMLILGLTNPEGKKTYIAAAFPSACGKTNLAMLTSILPGWKIECVGDDIAWMAFDQKGQLRAINPEAGFFGVAPGTSLDSNPVAMKTIEKNTIFTNVALTDDGDVWWEGLSKTPPDHLISWEGKEWTPKSEVKAAQPNARFTVSAAQCPIIDPQWQSPEGVPISAILFGGRRATTIPLVVESLSWNHGVFLGASMTSETTAAAIGEVGKIRHDPFAMLPFCGYNMGDYFAHWIEMGKKSAKLPKIFHVNWFRKGADGKFLWPGFGHNIYVLKWIFERLAGAPNAELSPVGYLPKKGLFEPAALTTVDSKEYLAEVADLENYFKQFGSHLPPEISSELKALKDRLCDS